MNVFQGDIPVVNLLGSKSRPKIKSYNGDRITRQFSESFTFRITSFSREKNVTVFAILVTGINTLLYRYTQQDDLVIGTAVAGREHPDLEDQIGAYLNILALRTKIDKEETFASLLRKQEQILINAFENQHYPFEDLVGHLNFKRDTSRSPLFDFFVVFQNYDTINLGRNNDVLTGISVENYDFGKKTSQFDISFIFEIKDNCLSLTLEYNSDIYRHFFVERMLDHFERLVSHHLDNSFQPISNINYLSDDELNHLLFHLNDTAVDYPKQKTIIDLFDEQVEKTPDNIALIFEDVQLTYRELNERSIKFANFLSSNYKSKNTQVIGVALERSDWAITALISIMKIGKTYLPIDSRMPKERVKFIADEARCGYIINQHALSDFELSKSNADVGVLYETSIARVAYIIYTSGSTGSPKGVLISTLSMLDYVLTFSCFFKISEDDRIIHQSSLSFDTHVEEIFPALISGATVLIALSPSVNLEDIVKLITVDNATILSTTPLVIQEINKRELTPSNLRCIISGGDFLWENHISNLFHHIPIYNTYGPSESTVCVTFNEVNSVSEAHLLGKPISNRRLYILDKNKMLVPKGVLGDIWVGGDGLLLGYCSGLKASVHIECLNDDVYCTGDIGRWTEDNQVECLGREDFHLKINGYRIDLLEVELALIKHEKIEEVFLHVIDEMYIIACYKSLLPISYQELKSFSVSVLPYFMVPYDFIHIADFPINSSGKFDRQSLLQIVNNNFTTHSNHRFAENSNEQIIVAAIAKLTGKEENQINTEDQLFNLGLNSVLILSLKMIIMEEIKVDLEIVKFFEFPTVRSLCDNCLSTTAICEEAFNDEMSSDEMSDLFD